VLASKSCYLSRAQPELNVMRGQFNEFRITRQAFLFALTLGVQGVSGSAHYRRQTGLH